MQNFASSQVCWPLERIQVKLFRQAKLCPCFIYFLWFGRRTDVFDVLRMDWAISHISVRADWFLQVSFSLCHGVSLQYTRTDSWKVIAQRGNFSASSTTVFVYQKLSKSFNFPSRLQYELLPCYIQLCGATLLLFTFIFIFHFKALSPLHQDLESFGRKDSFCNRQENQIVEKDFFFDSISTHLHSFLFFFSSFCLPQISQNVSTFHLPPTST